MNVMRKLRGAAGAGSVGGSSAANNGSPIGGNRSATDSGSPAAANGRAGAGEEALLDARIQMSLSTLKKLFNEYTHPKEPLSEQERDGKLYEMLPLFCKVFSSCPANDMSEKFWDVVAFCQQVSRLMVSEIRKRASNQSTEAASIAIVKFLEVETTEETSSGWMLLATLNLLANGDVSLIQVMTAAAVPSTLVKCLYLFFDLPIVEDDEPAAGGGTVSDFNAQERRTLLQKVFVQLLVKLCSYPYPAEELARMDDLTLLFSAITSPCPIHNIVWRKNAAEILTTISRHGLTDAVVSYIHSKGCMALCVDNMQRLTFGNPLEIVEMFVTVFCFLKDSSQVSQILMDDFRASQGYVFLSDFLLKFDNNRSQSLEIQAAIRNLVLMISSLCMCGFYELRPPAAQFNTGFKMQNFQLPQATSRETCVRNVYAFQVLQNVFLKSTTPALCCTILDAISRVYHSENANYFILESEHTLSSFAERIHLKSPQIQEKFYDLLEFIVFQLNFVPCKELISLSLLLKHNQSTACSILCLKTLLNILRHNSVFKDVYREVGILEIFVGCLTRYASHVLEITKGDENLVVEQATDQQEVDLLDTLGKLVLEALTMLLGGGANNNAQLFREYNGAKCVHELVKFKHCRPQALGIVRELILSAGGDDDMLHILSLMHSVSPLQVEFKIQILNMLLGCLKDSHRTRTVFRKVGGFVYLTSVFVSLDGSMAQPQPGIPQQDLILLLQIVCQTLATAMRFEPANAKFFHQEISSSSLCDTLRLLGCFGGASALQDFTGAYEPQQSLLKYYHEIFSGDILSVSFSENVPYPLSYVCIVFRLLYSIALDNFEAPNLSGIITLFSEPPAHTRSPSKELATPAHPSQLNLTQPTPEPRIVHPGVVLCMLQLLPAVELDAAPLQAVQLQVYLSEIIKSLVRSERNQQIMCDHGLAEKLLKLTRRALAEESHPLHVPMQYILERLAAQALQPTELRQFLRLGEPLSCADIDLQQAYKQGGPVPLTRIKTLVSMTTPRDFRAHGSSTLPPFVELDMSAEGFGCLYLPSLAPQATATAGGTIDANTIGGIGAGDRIFPPQTGLTYSTWFCVEKFSDPKTDPHCVRLLTLVRTIHNPREENLACLSILLSARDKAIVVSTQETLVTPRKSIGDWEPEGSDDGIARIWCPDLLHEGQWHNLVVVLNRAVLKNSSLSLYLDGVPMHTQKLHYIAQHPGASSANLTSATQIFGYIGTPPIWRRYSRLCWKQGVCHLLEDVLAQQTVQTIYQLGPHYMGSLQAPQLGKQSEPLAPLVPEDRVLLGLNAKAVSKLTLVKIRKVYSRADNKSIAKQLNMNSHENATPIKILHNSAGHLAGAGRSLGGVVVGYLGVRVFSPHPVSAMIDTVGGCNVLLGIIAMAQDVESLYAGVKALTCVVRSNRAAQAEMDRKRCYQTLGMFFKKKKHLLNSHILHLTFGLVGTVNSQDMSAIPNVTAFQDLLCDLEIWHNAPNGLLRSLLEHLLELVVESSDKKQNIKIMRDLQLLVKLLHIITQIQDHSTREILFSLLETLLGGQPRHTDLLLFGQYVAAKLPRSQDGGLEAAVLLPSMKNPSDDQDGGVAQNIYLRNRCLSLLHGLLFTPRNTVNYVICDDISKTLGMDWLLLFMQPHVHFTTVIIAVRVLVVVCANESFLVRFREANHNGGYLRFTEMVSQRKMGLGAQQLNQRPTNGTGTVIVATPQNTIQHLPTQIAGEVRAAALNIPGFQLLEWLMQHHLDVPELYFLVTALIMGQPVKVLATEHTKFDLDRVWSFLWGAPVSANTQLPKLNVCPEGVCVLLAMVRGIVHGGECAPWLHSHPETIIQLLFSLYQNLSDFAPVMMAGDVVTSLVAVLFPPTSRSSDSEPNSGASTPTDGTGSSFVLPPPETLHGAQQPKLTAHPVCKCIIDFLRVIVVDSLGLNMQNKATPVIDLVLDAAPDTAELPLQVQYQTQIIIALMDHLLAADVLVGEQAALPLVPLLQSQTQHIAPNVFYLTARIVDKLWQGCLARNPHDIFDFVIKLIAQAKRRSSSLSLEHLHHSLNRSILFLLSRPTDDSRTDQVSVLEALHKIIQHRLLIFGAGNHELEFIGCLTYCLMQLTADMKIILEPATSRNTTWHVNPQTETVEPKDEDLNQLQGRNLIVGAAFRVWEELYVCKKPAIEEVFKVSLTPPPANSKAPDLQTTREQVMELASKLWFNYVEAERKASYRAPWELHTQIQSKIQKVTGGLSRLTSRTKAKKEELVRTKSTMSREAAYESTGIHVQLVKDLLELRTKQYQQMMQHTQRYVYQDWVQSETELTRERGLWGPAGSCSLDKWILDTTEGPHRMRKKTMRNDVFYLHYPYRPELELADNRQLKYKVASSLDSKTYALHGQQQPRILAEAGADQHSMHQQSSLEAVHPHRLEASSSTSTPPPPISPKLVGHGSAPYPQESIDGNAPEDDEEEEDTSMTSDNETFLRLLEEQEKISFMFRCARVQGLDTFEGLLLFGKEHCYIVDGFTLLKNREIRDIDTLPPGAYEPIIPNSGGTSSSTSRAVSHKLRQCSKFAYEEIREVHKRRYLLQPIALEVFSEDGRNYLLSFPRKVRNKVNQRFLALATALNDNAQQSVAGQKRTASVEQTAGIFSGLIGETSVTQRWVRGEISNFQYLMHLNTLAGRSYNDLMQYPVFPWILADYDSEELDLTNPKTFRDFSRPMGAQAEERLEQFQKRFKEWDDPHGETPPYHYGTHYSSAMIVCSYLVRLEPFSQPFLKLQGGHFDLADRMFHSIKEAWLSASKLNMADVKELIPEFFYLPEFLSNFNSFDLGTKQNGETLNHVILPPWAKQDPREFIRLHRSALECDYVSQHLHLWIDLIFGCKQQGPAAVDSVNVFHHLFYEGNVDIYNIDDPLKKNATIGFINNFGQIPKQLFKKAHPAKKMGSSRHSALIDPTALIQGNSTVLQTDRLFFHNLDNLKPSLQPIKELKGPVGQILQPDKTVFAVEQNKVMMPPSYTKYIAWGFADHSLRVGLYDTDRASFVSEAAAQNSGEILTCACPNAKMIVTAGTSSVVTIWKFDANRKSLSVKHSLHGHTDAVTCLAASAAYNVIVSGSRDGTAIVWDMTRFTFVRQLRGHAGVVAAVAINELTGEIATCSATWLHVWSINGDALAMVNTCVGSADRMQQILCVAFSQIREWDQQNVVITGSTDGVVRMWSLEHTQVPIDRKLKRGIEVNSQDKPDSASLDSKDNKDEKMSLFKQMKSLSQPEEEEQEIVKSASESSISEASQHSKESSKSAETGAKAEEPLVERRNSSISGAKSLHEMKSATVEAPGCSSSDPKSNEDEHAIRPSKSDTSLTDGFVVIDNDRHHRGDQVLRKGFRWQRQLMFRSKLTMHTAYDRKDNAEPASITALTVSKDHKILYVGDARGRIFSWSVTEQPGRGVADHWLKDEGADQCVKCHVKFTLYERKHHCRNCGQVFCNKCSRFESEISRLRILKPVRVCQACYSQLRTSSFDN